MDLAQDSDEDNERIRKRKRNQPADLEFDSPFIYYDKPFHGVNRDGVPDVCDFKFLSDYFIPI